MGTHEGIWLENNIQNVLKEIRCVDLDYLNWITRESTGAIEWNDAWGYIKNTEFLDQSNNRRLLNKDFIFLKLFGCLLIHLGR
jgi:hypothetical protein